MKTLLSQFTYIIILIISILLIVGLVYVHRKMCAMTDDKEQQIAWQTLNNTIEQANSLFEKNETACVEIAKFAPSLENDTALLYHALSQLLKNNTDLRATFIYFYDSTRKQNAYLMRDKNHIERVSFNDYISEIKQKFLREHFEKNHLKPFWENPIILENQTHINLFVPFSDKFDRLKGFVGLSMSLAWADILLHSALTYYENDAHAFMFMLSSDRSVVSIAGDITIKNQDIIKVTGNDNAFTSMTYNMRNGETGSVKLNNDYTNTDNMFLYKSLTNRKISIALSYHENQSMNEWNRLFLMCMGALLLSFVIITLWLWWYWKRRMKVIEQIGASLYAIENGSTISVLPSSPQHQDLQELCLKIENMQRGIELRKRELVSSTGVFERKNNERELAQYIRRYFYAFQAYDASLSQKIHQHIKTHYLPDVGGDFHDYFNIAPQLICFVTGNVSRPKKDLSNIQTSIDILMTMNLIRSHLKAYSSLDQSIFHLNNDLYSQNNGNFTVNLFMGVLNCETGMLEFISAGAPTHYMISHRSIFSFTVQHGLPLASRQNEEYSIGIRELSNGDMLMIHTAGVLSRQNINSDKYGPLRLQQVMAASSGMKPDMFLEKIVEDIAAFTEKQSAQVDDYTLLAIKYEAV